MQKEALHEAALVRWNGAPSLNYKSTQSNYYPHLTMFGSHLHSHTSRFRHPCPNSASLLMRRMYTRKETHPRRASARPLQALSATPPPLRTYLTPATSTL